MIKWELFLENSSTTEALFDFARGTTNFTQFKKNVGYFKEIKKEVEKLRNRGYDRARKNAKDALRRRGYDSEDFCCGCECHQ